MSECDPLPTGYCSKCCQHRRCLGGGTPLESPPARYKIVKVLISSFENFLVYYALPSGGFGFAGPTLPSRLRMLSGRCCSRSLTAFCLHTGRLQQAHKTVRDLSLVSGSFRWVSSVYGCGPFHQYRTINKSIRCIIRLKNVVPHYRTINKLNV